MENVTELYANGVLGFVDSLALDIEVSVKLLIGALIIVGALLMWVKSSFSIKTLFIGLVMVAIATAFLSQLDVFQGLFEETLTPDASSHQIVDVLNFDNLGV